MTDYFEHNAKRTNRQAVSFDVIEFDQPQTPGIEVEEHHFDSTGQFLAFVARETGRGP